MKEYTPLKVDRIWLWVYYNKILIYPIFYLHKGTMRAMVVHSRRCSAGCSGSTFLWPWIFARVTLGHALVMSGSYMSSSFLVVKPSKIIFLI